MTEFSIRGKLSLLRQARFTSRYYLGVGLSPNLMSGGEVDRAATDQR